MDHISEQFTAYLHGELSADEASALELHLAACEACKGEMGQVRFADRLAGKLDPRSAGDHLWERIEENLDGRSTEPQMGLIPDASFWTLRRGFAFGVSLVAVFGLFGLAYITLFTGESPYQASVPDQTGPGANIQQQGVVNASPDVNTNVNTNTNSNSNSLPTSTEGFAVETLAGSPSIDGGTDRIGVGQFLETDGTSKARITVADIGTVDVSPNSRVRLEETGKDEHRLSLERGKLHAKILAPPRLFVVDTPSAKAVDLGCEYTLDVDKNGDSVLHVTGGWVALERDGRESIVPAGMMCKTRKGRGLGTPFNVEATEAFKRALDSFDFSRGGSAAVQTMLREAELYDMFTLWHLLSRVTKEDRGAVYDTLADIVPPPSGVTRDGILALDKKMLAAWKIEVENAWFS
jgi:hypothetical protein